MAFTTLVSFGRALTDAERVAESNYVAGQMANGNTTGIYSGCKKTGLDLPIYGDLKKREWQTQDQANAYVAFCNTFNPAPTWTEVAFLGNPFVITQPS